MNVKTHETETCPCGLCGTETMMTGTKRCNRCWELEMRIEMDPKLARKILERVEAGLKKGVCKHGTG